MTTTTHPHRTSQTSQTTQQTVIGSLCTGYGGLDMGAAAALGGNARLAWVADNAPHIRRLLCHRFPDTFNLGDLSEVRWSHVQPVDVITAGFPCQDISAAGRGAGIEKGERSSVWRYVMEAVRHARPNLLVLENVAALRWRGRGFDRVLADLASAGYDAQWCCVRASDIGAPHRRERIFILAAPASHTTSSRLRPGRNRSCPTTCRRTTDQPHRPHHRVATSNVHERYRRLHDTSRAHRTPNICVRPTQAPAHPTGVGHLNRGMTCGNRLPSSSEPSHKSRGFDWGIYAPAIHHWERVLGRPAPQPHEWGQRGRPRLSPRWVEWLMGLPEGWVTDPDLGMPRRFQLHALGNGVLPQQATVAVRHLLAEMAHAGGTGAAWD